VNGKKIIGYRSPKGSTITVAVADKSFLLDFGGTFIKIVSALTNAIARLNSENESSNDSNDGWESKAARTAEPDTVINVPATPRKYLVKLHNLTGRVISRHDEGKTRRFDERTRASHTRRFASREPNSG